MLNPNGASDSQLILERASAPAGLTQRVLNAWPGFSR